MSVIVYRMEVVGGPYDGCGGMRWVDDGEHPVPELILLGVCRGNGQCRAGESAACARNGKRHPYYWLPEEPERPPRTTPYELSESYLLPEEPQGRVQQYPGRAIYVIGGLHLPREREARELVGAGAGPGVGQSMESSRVHAGYVGPMVGFEGPGVLYG